VVVLDMGQRRGQRDKSEGQKGGIGWVPCQQWCLGGHIWRWRGLRLVCVQTAANSIVYSNFADVCAFEDVIAKISTVVPQAQIGWLVVRCRGRHYFRYMPVSNCQFWRWLCGLL
jgi:hypothetical protein